MPDEPTATAPAPAYSECPDLVPLDRFTASFQLRMALSRKRFGHVKSEVDRTVTSLVADIVTEALADAGIVLAQPRRPYHTVPLGEPKSTRLTD